MSKRRDEPELNIWPGFSDLLIAVILMLILYLFLQEITFRLSEAYKFERMRNHQIEFKEKLVTTLGEDSTIIADIDEDGTIQKISFKSAFLFESGRTQFKDGRSKDWIAQIGNVIKKVVHKGYINTIVVEGHTNSRPFQGRFGNWRLSAMRALEVVKILDELELHKAVPKNGRQDHPSRILSLSGFGKYDYVPDKSGNEDFEESKRIQFTLEYDLEWSGFLVTDLSIKRMELAGLPYSIVAKIVNIKDKVFTREEMFISVLKSMIGDEELKMYRKEILKICSMG